MKNKIITVICCLFGLTICSIPKMMMEACSAANSNSAIHEDVVNAYDTVQLNEEIHELDGLPTNSKNDATAAISKYVETNKIKEVNGKQYSVVQDDETGLLYDVSENPKVYSFGIFNSKKAYAFTYCILLKCPEVEYITKEYNGYTVFPYLNKNFSITYVEGNSISNGYDFDSQIGGGFGGFVQGGVSIGVSQEQTSSSETTMTIEYEFTDDFIDKHRTANFTISICRISFLVMELIPKFDCNWTMQWIKGFYLPEIKEITVDLYTVISIKEGGQIIL